MIRKAIGLSILLGLLVGCKASTAPFKPSPSPPLSAGVPSNISSSQVSTPPAGQALTPTTTPAGSPMQTPAEYCEQLLENYQPSPGFQTYCDKDYGFAFDYPSSWRKTIVAQSPDTAANPSTVRRELSFDSGDMSNYIRTNTYHIYGLMTLRERVEYSIGYNERAFPDKSYPSIVLGGHKAYVIMQCRWGQAYSSVKLYFQHGQYYTILEFMVINQIRLDTNWELARSIQIPGYAPENNVIPQELIDDSYQLLDCHVPPTQIGSLTPSPTPSSKTYTDNIFLISLEYPPTGRLIQRAMQYTVGRMAFSKLRRVGYMDPLLIQSVKMKSKKPSTKAKQVVSLEHNLRWKRCR